VGRFFNSSDQGKRAVPWPLGADTEGLARMTELRRHAACSPRDLRGGNLFGPPEKAISRVVIGYVGGPLSHRGRGGAAGCFVGHSWHVCEFRGCCVTVASDWPRDSPAGSKIVLKFGSAVSGVVETEVWTPDKQPVALLAKI
jgi:hypothetical protein